MSYDDPTLEPMTKPYGGTVVVPQKTFDRRLDDLAARVHDATDRFGWLNVQAGTEQAAAKTMLEICEAGIELGRCLSQVVGLLKEMEK